MLNQKLQQKLLQKLSPQQIQLMKLLEIPTAELEQRIKQEIEENPALEGDEEDDILPEDNQEESFDDDGGDGEEIEDINESKEDDFSLEDFMDDDDIPEYKLSVNNSSSDDEDKSIPFTEETSFFELLEEQLRMRDLSEKEQLIGNYIIGSLDDNGYLSREPESIVNDLAFTRGIETNVEEVVKLLKIIQQFDPPGVGARTLQECLIIQLRFIEKHSPIIAVAIDILENSFDEFSKKHYDKLLKKHNLSDGELKQIIEIITRLNPKPGNSSGGGKSSIHVFPDFTITNHNGELELSVNSRNVPDLRVNKSYINMLDAKSKDKNSSRSEKEMLQFVKQKIDSAKWFIDALKQRQNTLYVTMYTIMEHQQEYFLTGDETKLKPMILKDIAEKVGLDISTISRVSSSKYVQTPFGTFLLKTFFSESLQNDNGEEVSSREIKSILSRLIEGESKNKPLTDDELALSLKENGYNIARRTVAKYREQLNIPVARLRKEI